MDIYRKMLVSDLKQVYQIEVDVFSMPWTYEALIEEVVNENAYYIVVEIEGQIIGYAGLRKIFNEGHITNIAIADLYRRSGYGEKLMKALHSYSKDAEIDQFTLEVRASNFAAITMYEKLGYVTIGMRKGFYELPKEDALIMWLK